MRKMKLFAIVAAFCSLVCGCSCSKVSETTYENAVESMKNTDGIAFSRIEKAMGDGEEFYTHKRIDAVYIFDNNKYVNAMQYSRSDSTASTVGNSMTNDQKVEYYYSAEKSTMYHYLKIGNQKEERVKEAGITYNDVFNIDVCEDLDCSRMINGNIVPIFKLNEVVDFEIKDNKGLGEVSFKAVCPSFESCASSSQMIEYKIVLGKDGNIQTMSYEIENQNKKYYISYTFKGIGADNLSVEYPKDLENYIEK